MQSFKMVSVSDLQSWRRSSIAFMVMTVILAVYGGFATYQWSGAAADRDYNFAQAQKYFQSANKLTSTDCGHQPAAPSPWRVVKRVYKIS